MTTIRMIVVRHAQTFDNGHLPLEPGRSPWDLSPLGRAQCRHLGTALAERLDCAPGGVAIVSSTAAQAVETAEAIRQEV